MGQQKGSSVSIKMGFETTFGVQAGTGFYLPVGYGENVIAAQNITTRNLITGNRNPSQGIRGYRRVGGPLPIPVDSVALIYWLIAMFGDPTSSGSDPYVHEFKIGSSMPSFTIEKAMGDFTSQTYEQLLGCKIAGFNIDFGGEGELVMNLDVVGASEDWDSSSFDMSATTPTPAYINQFDGAVEEGGASSDIVTGVSLSVDFGLDMSDENIPINDSGVRTSIPEGDVKISGSVKAQFDEDGYTLLQKGLNGTESSLKLTYTESSTSVFELELQELEYGRAGIGTPNAMGFIVDMPFTAHYSSGGEASAIVARVTNETASYDLV